MPHTTGTSGEPNEQPVTAEAETKAEAHAETRRAPGDPDRTAPPEDGAFTSRVRARQYGAFLRMARRNQRQRTAARAVDLDLWRLPYRQSRPGREQRREARRADPGSRPDGRRQSRSRPDPPRAVAGDGRARVRTGGPDDRAHDGGDDGGLCVGIRQPPREAARTPRTRAPRDEAGHAALVAATRGRTDRRPRRRFRLAVASGR